MSAKSGGSRRLPRPSLGKSSSSSASGGGLNSIAWRQLALPLIVVVVVVVATLLAHAKTPKTDQATGATTAVTLTRTLSCVRDARASSTRIGTVPTSASGVTLSGSRVTFAPKQAADGYATQWATGRFHKTAWLAARACPALGDDWWFVGVGSSQLHDGVLTLDNPEPVEADFSLTFYGPDGEVDVPGGFAPIPAGGSKSFDLASIAATKQGDLTLHIRVTRGLLSASVWDTWARTSLYASTHQWVPASLAPAKRIQLMTVPGMVALGSTLLVTNPGSTNAVVQVKAVNSDATFAPTKFNVLDVPPGATLSVPFGDLHKVALSSLILTSNARVSATLRSVSGGTEAYAVPGQPIGAESTAGLPAGVPASLTLTSTTAATVAVQVVDARGVTVLTRSVKVPAGTAVTTPLPKTGVAVRLTSGGRGDVVAAISLAGEGIAMIAMAPTANTARVPLVVAQPY